jgi:hypothetical protein
MQMRTAIKVIQKEAKFLGIGFLETLQFIKKNPLAQPQTTMEAYRIVMAEGTKLFSPVDQ